MPRQDHDDLKSGGGRRDLGALKKRLEAKVPGQPGGPTELEVAQAQVESLKEYIRATYQSAIESEDARDFILGTIEGFKAKIESWGEKPMTAQEYMDAQEAAHEKAKDEADFERLKRKLGR